MANKIELGQFFTKTNPFINPAFFKWIKNIPENKINKIIEPFAGSNNIPAMIDMISFMNNIEWNCYDIEPAEENIFPEAKIIQKDTINDWPKTDAKIAITNPPYLGKSSASRKGINYTWDYDDLYKVCLDIMLKNLDYVAAIIPETFIIAKEFQDRLMYIVSLTCIMFDDTECPVCLAMFGPEKYDTEYWIMEEYIGNRSELEKYKINSCIDADIKFNIPNGEIGINCIDSKIGKTIKFCKGEEIIAEIKNSSRSITRISINENIDINKIINKANDILEEYRNNTSDLFLASFKGLRKDGHYRRRLDFATARAIINKAIESVKINA